MYKKKINRLKNFVEHILDDVNLPIMSGFLDWFVNKLEMHFLKPTPNLVFKKGDLYFVDLGKNIGSELNKIRPCVVYSKKQYNFGGTILVIPLKLFKGVYKRSFSVFIASSLKNSLRKDSIVDISSFRQVSKKRILNKIGKLEKKDLLLIDKKLMDFLGLKEKSI